VLPAGVSAPRHRRARLDERAASDRRFEQEFIYTGVEDRRKPRRRAPRRRFEDRHLPARYGPRQYEVTTKPAPALTAADQAVIVREMARATAFRLGHRVIFSPMPVADGVGSGVHIHFSLHDAQGRARYLRAEGTARIERACLAILRRRAAPSPGDHSHHRAISGIIFAAHAEPLDLRRFPTSAP
jgi:glutamine synthetase